MQCGKKDEKKGYVQENERYNYKNWGGRSGRKEQEGKGRWKIRIGRTRRGSSGEENKRKNKRTISVLN